MSIALPNNRYIVAVAGDTGSDKKILRSMIDLVVTANSYVLRATCT